MPSTTPISNLLSPIPPILFAIAELLFFTRGQTPHITTAVLMVVAFLGSIFIGLSDLHAVIVAARSGKSTKVSLFMMFVAILPILSVAILGVFMQLVAYAFGAE